MDTITVDTSLTIEKYYKMNFLRKDISACYHSQIQD